jgi:voltage-gated potassium channel
MAKNEESYTPGVEENRSAVYEMFIVVLTFYSLLILFLIIAPFVSPEVTQLLLGIDFIISVIFLVDFFNNLRITPNRSHYFFKQGGWLDLLGSIPAIPSLPWTAIFRVARVVRLFRIIRIMRQRDMREIIDEFKTKRAESALTVTAIVALLTISTAAIVVLIVEVPTTESNIETGTDAFWWAFVTVTTVGYGDLFPVTGAGRFFAMILMVVGVGIFGVMTSYLSAAFVGDDAKEKDKDDTVSEAASLQEDLDHVKSELASIKQLLREMNG